MRFYSYLPPFPSCLLRGTACMTCTQGHWYSSNSMDASLHEVAAGHNAAAAMPQEGKQEACLGKAREKHILLIETK